MQPLDDQRKFRINEERRCKSTCRFEIDIGFGTATALSILTRHWTDNISNNLHSDNKKSLVCLLQIRNIHL